MKKNYLFEYSKKLAIEIEEISKTITKKKGLSNEIFQLKKSSSSVFANVAEAQYPQSLPDMLSKLKIARKECFETESWLQILFSINAIDELIFKNERNLCGRIRRIITSSCKTIEEKIKKS